ncbi:hypothetical protein RHMOL_Rhmol06G0244900 [Rhododendron molle]|uniref:Uncharacterized protein n=1 Tax=Rhododendron molle TaxID=49168 RepID=A0ACC0NH36_RHOML|nr:hypothetical protein RHMOL_Rhmol06G0244900 [Rhododendron molle]
MGLKVVASIAGPDVDRAIYKKCDVTVEKQVEETVAFAIEKYGTLDIMYSNAGIFGPMASILDMDMEDGFDRTMAVNLRGPALCIKHAARAMVKRQVKEMATKGNVSIKIEDDDDVEVGGVADSLWSKKNEAFFIDIMEEEVKTMGSRDTGTFQIKSWARMRKSLSARAKYEYSELQIKNKFNQLRTMHTKFKSLCDQSGVGWCAEKGTVTADDTLWEKLYKVNKKAKHFRKKGFPHYAAMTRILGDTTATGFNAHPSVHSPSETDSSDPSFQLKQDKDDGEIEVTNVVVSGKGKKVFDMKALKTTEPKESSKSKKRDSLSANLSASLSALAESSKRKVDILEAKHNAKSTSVSVTSQDHGEPQGLLAECIKTLNAMEDLDGASFTKGMKLLKDDPSWRPIFLGMSEQRKKDFISYV